MHYLYSFYLPTHVSHCTYPYACSNIFEAELNESYASHLFALDHKLRYVREQESGRVPAIDAVAPELDKLRLQVHFPFFLWFLPPIFPLFCIISRPFSFFSLHFPSFPALFPLSFSLISRH